MNIFFYAIIFMIGITFGSFYTLAVHRIPKRQDITHTHSYCPKCNHKLGILDLIPVLSYIILGAKCRYCKEKIRPRYFILEIISGLFFILVAYLIGINIYNCNLIKIIEYSFWILYFTFIILIAGIDKETKMINKSVLMYGVIISIIYIIYLYVIEKTSIYRYVIYLILLIFLLILDTINLRKNAKNSYIYSILIFSIIMSIFTGEYITISSIIMTLLYISIYSIIKRFQKSKENKIFKIGFYLSVFNILFFIVVSYSFIYSNLLG